MSVHQRRAMDALKEKLLVLGARAEESVFRAIRSVEEHDENLALEVIEGDYVIDQMEVEIEEECLKILALYQPVAIDLRFIVAVLKMNNDLERIGDVSVNIAERAVFLARRRPSDTVIEFGAMAEKTQMMLKGSLDALVNMDGRLARRICAADDDVDAMNRDMFTEVQEGIRRSLDDLEPLIHMLSISRHLERIADLATNIAEDVIYMVEGEIIRHHAEDFTKDSEL